MGTEDLEQLIAHMRQIGNDTQTCEVKEASSKLPESVVETLSAFSNGTGGTLILGLSEKNGFMPVSNFNATAMQEWLAAACAKMTPPVRPITEILPFEGINLLVAEIPRPCPRKTNPAT